MDSVDELFVNLPDEKELVFDHKRWQENVFKAEETKSQLQATMLSDALAVWVERGKEAFEAAAEESPTGFIRAVQNLLPKKVDVDLNQTMNVEGNVMDSPRLAALKSLLNVEQDTPKLIEGETIKDD